MGAGHNLGLVRGHSVSRAARGRQYPASSLHTARHPSCYDTLRISPGQGRSSTDRQVSLQTFFHCAIRTISEGAKRVARLGVPENVTNIRNNLNEIVILHGTTGGCCVPHVKMCPIGEIIKYTVLRWGSGEGNLPSL